MRHVYLVSAGSHEDWTLLGVYSTWQIAEEVVKFYERPHSVDFQEEPFSRKANDILEVPVDEPWADRMDWPLNRPHVVGVSKTKRYTCPECGMPTDGNSRHKAKGGEDCDMVMGRRGWRQLGVYDG